MCAVVLNGRFIEFNRKVIVFLQAFEVAHERQVCAFKPAVSLRCTVVELRSWFRFLTCLTYT